MSPQGTDTGKPPDSSKRRGQSARHRPPSKQIPRDKDPDVLKYDAEGEPLSLAEEIAEEVARAMAEGALTHSAADIAVSVTGIAGPGGSEHKPEGRVCFALAAHGARTLTETVEFGAIGRKAVRAASVTHALLLMERHLSRIA